MDGLEAIFRWMHIFVGILWIGHLYYFNFVNGQMAAKLDAAAKKAVVPELMPRALFWFRWGAAWTWITGVLLLLVVYYHGGQALAAGASWGVGPIVMVAVTFLGVFVYDAIWRSGLAANVRGAVIVTFLLLSVVVALFVYFGEFSYRGTLIHTGALFGSSMAFNVWYRIWPAQQKIIRAIKKGEAPEPALAALAGLRSKHNTYMSLPLFWAMIGQHTTYFAGGNLGIPGELYWVFWLVIIALGWHIIFQCYKKAGKVPGF
ncbi:MAG TPA: urate hydroxylase PuuD [Vicinamibacteria bacterium]|nr:urate hydroxylase PuuD [Vicinamibacteria bacterium]